MQTIRFCLAQMSLVAPFRQVLSLLLAISLGLAPLPAISQGLIGQQAPVSSGSGTQSSVRDVSDWRAPKAQTPSAAKAAGARKVSEKPAMSATLMAQASSPAVMTAQTPRTAAADPVTEDESVPDYRLASNDKLKITVFGEDDLSGDFVVDASGNISMPLIGEVPAAGLSLRALQRSIEVKLRAGYLVDPRVSAEMLNFRPFYVLGEVKNPGEYPYATGLTLLNAIAQAGGFTPLANTAELGIRRDKASDEERMAIRAGQIVLPGDTIRVDKAVVYILGEVDEPGEYPIPPGLNVVTAVAQAGGYTALADINNIVLKRAGMNEELVIPTSSAQLVKAGDTLRVEKSSFFILGEVTKPGEYPLLQALTVNSAAALAGGFTFRADVRRVFIRRAGEAEERAYKLDSNLRVQKGDTIRVPERFF
jgi:protein involved in polysaccharide export with SLBB domain